MTILDGIRTKIRNGQFELGAFLSWGTSFSAEMPAHLVPRPCFLSTHPTPTCHRIGGGTLLPRLSFVIENLSLLVSEGALLAASPNFYMRPFEFSQHATDQSYYSSYQRARSP
jgi:hypothetical protein